MGNVTREWILCCTLTLGCAPSQPVPDSTLDSGEPDSTLDSGGEPDSTLDSGGEPDSTLDSGEPDSTLDSGKGDVCDCLPFGLDLEPAVIDLQVAAATLAGHPVPDVLGFAPGADLTCEDIGRKLIDLAAQVRGRLAIGE